MANKLSRQHRVLLANSETTKDFPFLIKVIKENIELNEKTIIDFSLHEQQVINNLPEIIKIAELEWEGNPIPEMILEGNDRIDCSLCGTDNKLIFYIENRNNNIKLNVGSRCITKFTIMENQGLNIKSIIREAEKERRRILIDKKYPGIRPRINNWFQAISNFEILLPSYIEKKYIVLGERAKKLFTQSLKSKDNDPDLDIFDEIFKQADDELIQIENYVEKHKTDKNIIPKDMEIWLKDNGKSWAIKELKKNGFINIYNAGYITEPNFMNKMINTINQMNNQPYLCSVLLQNYIVKLSNFNDIELLVSPTHFIQCFGNYIFYNKFDINVKDLIKYSQIANDLSRSNLIKRSYSLLQKINSSIESIDDDNTTITIGNYQTDIFVQINLREYVGHIKMLIFGYEQLDQKAFQNFIFSRSQYTHEQIKNMRYIYSKGQKAQYEELGRDRR